MQIGLARNLPKLVLFRACFWMHFLSAVIVPFYTEWGGLTLAQVLSMNAWFMAWNFALEVPTGAVADVFGRKWSMVLGALCAAGAAMLYIATRSVAVFLLAEVLYAVAYTLVSGAEDAVAYDTLLELGTPERAPRVVSHLESSKLVGIIVGALAGSMIAARWGVAAPMAAQAIPALLGAAVAATLVEPVAHHAAAPPTGYTRMLFAGVRRLAAHPTLRLLAFDMVAINAVAWVIIWLYQPLCQAAGLDPLWFGTVHAAMCVAQIAVLQWADRIEGWLGSARRWLVLSAVLTGVALVVVGVSRSLPIVIAACFAVEAFGLTRGARFQAYLNHHIASAERATVLSTVSMLRTIALVIGQLVTGQMTRWSLHGTVVVLGVIAVVLALGSRVQDDHLTVG